MHRCYPAALDPALSDDDELAAAVTAAAKELSAS
jgi:hypothetical protein